MYIEAILGLFIPTVLLGALIASMIFYSIVKNNKKLQRKLATGSRASRELLYGYLAVNTDQGVVAPQDMRRSQAKKSRAQIYDFAYERRKRG